MAMGGYFRNAGPATHDGTAIRVIFLDVSDDSILGRAAAFGAAKPRDHTALRAVDSDE